MVTAHELRFALVVDDYDAGIALFRDALGLEVLEEFDRQAGRGALLAVDTPWGDRNQRFETAGLQLTLFRPA